MIPYIKTRNLNNTKNKNKKLKVIRKIKGGKTTTHETKFDESIKVMKFNAIKSENER